MFATSLSVLLQEPSWTVRRMTDSLHPARRRLPKCRELLRLNLYTVRPELRCTLAALRSPEASHPALAISPNPRPRASHLKDRIETQAYALQDHTLKPKNPETLKPKAYNPLEAPSSR